MDKYLKLINDVLRQHSPALQAQPASPEGLWPSPVDFGGAREQHREPEAPAALAHWRQGVTRNSRGPLIPEIVRAKIEAIEQEARAKGWPAELLWNGGFWDCPRGLAAVLGVNDEIIEVTADCITILASPRSLQRFPRRAS